MRWKWIPIIISGLFLLLIMAGYVVLSLYDFNGLKPQIAHRVEEATGRKVTIGGDIRLGIGLTPTLTVGEVALQNAPWSSQPQMAEIERLKVQVALLPLLFGRMHFKQLVVVGPRIWLETDGDGRSNLTFRTAQEPRAPEPKAETPGVGAGGLPALTFSEVKVVNARVTYHDGRTATTHEATLESLTAGAAHAGSPIELECAGSFEGRPIQVAGTVGPLVTLTDPTKPWPLDIKVEAADVTLGLHGTIDDPLALRGMDLRLAMRGENPQNLAQLAGLSLSVSGPFEASGRLSDLGPKSYRISDLKTTLGESHVSGSAELNLATRQPSLTATLSSRKLDLRSWFPKSASHGDRAQVKSARAAVKKDRIFPHTPLPLDALQQADVVCTMSADQVLLPNLVLDRITLEARLREGALTVDPMKALIGGGSVEGRFTVEARGREAAMSAVLKMGRIDLGRTLRELGTTGSVEGRLHADIEVRGLGNSLAGLMGGLNGKTLVTMGRGRIDNKYIGLLGADLASSVLRLLNPFHEEADHTVINCLVSGFEIRDGLAVSTALVFDTPRMTVVGDGRIDLRTERLDVSLKPAPKQGIGTRGIGRITLSLGDLAKPFKLGGTLARPTLALDVTQSAITLGKAAGGVVLFGPVGIAAALAGASSDDENPCLTAIEAAKKGVRVPNEGTVEKAGQKAKDALKGIGSGLKKLFGQ